jgi:hypothetical protein
MAKKAIKPEQMFAVHVRASADKDGRPRSGWICFGSKDLTLYFVDEGFDGIHALMDVYPTAFLLISIPTTVECYNNLVGKESAISGGGISRY